MFVRLGVNKRAEFQLAESQIQKQESHALCGNHHAERLHRVGEILTKPLLREMSTATRLFGPHKWPGESEGSITNRERVYRVLRGIELFTLVIPMVSIVLGVIGIALKSLAVQWAPPAAVIENPNISFKEYQNEINLVTYNLCLMPTYIANVNGVTEPRGRAAQIGQVLSRSSDRPDIICFQETFHAESTRILANTLRELYPQVLHSISPNETFLNSGLMIATQYKILDVRYRPFENGLSEDALANKGLVRVLLDLGEGKTAVVYNTHLQAKKGERYVEVRKEQLQQIRGWIESDDNAGHEAVLLAGDFNLHLGELDDALEILGEAFVRQLPTQNIGTVFEQTSEAGWGSIEWTRQTQKDKQIDHIFAYQGQDQGCDISNQWLNEPTTRSGLSDHLPVQCRYTNNRDVLEEE